MPKVDAEGIKNIRVFMEIEGRLVLMRIPEETVVLFVGMLPAYTPDGSSNVFRLHQDDHNMLKPYLDKLDEITEKGTKNG